MTLRLQTSSAIAATAAVLALGVLVSFVRGTSGRGGTTVTATIEPLSVTQTSKIGGVVAEVMVQEGKRVAEGQLLLRFESAELRQRRTALTSALSAVRAALDSSRATGALPLSVRPLLVDVHPEVNAAEERYVQALTRLDRAGAEDRIRAQADVEKAAADRIGARRRVSQILAKSIGTSGTGSVLTTMEDQLRVLDQAIAETEVRAPAGSIVEILDVRPGDRILPGAPAVIVALAGEYFCEFPVAEQDARTLRAGQELYGTIRDTGRKLILRIESMDRRRIPVALREDRRVEEEIVLRARFHSATPIDPGTEVQLELPEAGGR
jgi:multidrug efflux pump subunit AcrA (membrane-fusion protein)